MKALQDWFTTHISKPLLAIGILIEFHGVGVDNKKKKPGPVFLAMAKYAYELDVDYLYRVNDDTEFMTLWTSTFVYTLVTKSRSLLGDLADEKSLILGVVGPLSAGTDNRILTHDFVHRTHMEIFHLNYYPPEFTGEVALVSL